MSGTLLREQEQFLNLVSSFSWLTSILRYSPHFHTFRVCALLLKGFKQQPSDITAGIGDPWPCVEMVPPFLHRWSTVRKVLTNTDKSIAITLSDLQHSVLLHYPFINWLTGIPKLIVRHFNVVWYACKGSSLVTNVCATLDMALNK